MPSNRSLISDKARCFSQSETALYGNVIIISSKDQHTTSPCNYCPEEFQVHEGIGRRDLSHEQFTGRVHCVTSRRDFSQNFKLV